MNTRMLRRTLALAVITGTVALFAACEGPTTNGTQSYTVTFNADEGSSVPQDQTVASGDKVAKPVDPTKSDSAFGGWYKEAALTTPWNFDSDVVTGDMTLYAKWNIQLAVTGVSLNKTSLTLAAGTSEALAVKVSPATAINRTVLWTSSDTSCATVANGTVTAVAGGRATITVITADGGFMADCTVTVKVLDSISVSDMPSKTAYYLGETLDLAGITVTAHWSDSSTSTIALAGVEASGFEAALGSHTKTITVFYNGKRTDISGYSYTVYDYNYTFTADNAPTIRINVETRAGVFDFSALETYLNSNPGAYTLTLHGNIGRNVGGSEAAGSYTLNGTGNQLTITSGDTTERHIYKNSAQGAMFTITGGATLILGGHVTLHGIANNNKALVVLGDNSNSPAALELKGHAVITGNTNTSGISSFYSFSGGGVNAQGTNTTFIMRDNAAVSGNMSDSPDNTYNNNGGGVYVTGGIFTMMDNAVVADNHGGMGGGVCIVRATFTMQDSAVVSGNTAREGGGVRVDNGATFIMQDSAVISGNTGAGGGGVSVDGRTFIMQDSAVVAGNAAISRGSTNEGGGVRVSWQGTFTMQDNAVVSGNTSTYGGGVGASQDGTFTMQDSAAVSGNTAEHSGGGVLVSGGIFTMGDNAVVSGNTSIFGSGVWSGGGIFRIAGGTVYGYTAGDPNSNVPKSNNDSIGAALCISSLYYSASTAEYGSFTGNNWSGSTILLTDDGDGKSYSDATIKVVNGTLQQQ